MTTSHVNWTRQCLTFPWTHKNSDESVARVFFKPIKLLLNTKKTALFLKPRACAVTNNQLPLAEAGLFPLLRHHGRICRGHLPCILKCERTYMETSLKTVKESAIEVWHSHIKYPPQPSLISHIRTVLSVLDRSWLATDSNKGLVAT